MHHLRLPANKRGDFIIRRSVLPAAHISSGVTYAKTHHLDLRHLERLPTQ
jgi:hypothetical protein